MPIRITGLTSGLDTEAIISALVSSYNYKTNKYKKAQTKLSWKQDAWKTLNTKIYSFRLEFFNEIGFINKQIALVQFLVSGIVFFYGIEISRNRILRHIPLTKIRSKIFNVHV